MSKPLGDVIDVHTIELPRFSPDAIKEMAGSPEAPLYRWSRIFKTDDLAEIAELMKSESGRPTR